MISLLAKIFIKNNKNYNDTKVREQYGVLCGAFGIFLNIVLFALKFIFGTIAASVSMIADAFNNLSDAGSSLIQILGFKLSSKKPDLEHPFGHGRMEYISGLIVSFLILLMGFELGKSSVQNILSPTITTEINWISVGMMIVAILVKLYMYIYNHSVAKKIDSVSMEAIAKDSLSDMISTVVVILSLVIQPYVNFPVDGIAGVVVAIFILKTGIESAKETIEPLLGTAPTQEFVQNIEQELLLHKPIVGMHDLVVHDYGPDRLMISLHAEVPGDMNIFELHDTIDNAEVEISKKFNCHVIIHMDPIDVKNKMLEEFKAFLQVELLKIDSQLLFHDVRMVPGVTHTNFIFDVVKPFSLKLSDEELISKINDLVSQKYDMVNCVITIDQPFIK